MKKYTNIKDNIAFLSPCVAKSDEIHDKNTHGYVHYNVTFKKLLEYIANKNVNIDKFEEYDYDDVECGLGLLFSRPGGLRENIELKAPDTWVRQIEGQHHAYEYLNQYKTRRELEKEIPNVVDILNCSNGCNVGSAICHENNLLMDDYDSEFNHLKSSKLKQQDRSFLRKKKDSLFVMFDKTLQWEDFIRNYQRYEVSFHISEPSEADYEVIYNSMDKTLDWQKNINCSACGYGTCKNMARAIHNGLNISHNCINFNRQEVMNEQLQLDNQNEQMKILEELNNLSEEKVKSAELLKIRVSEIIQSVSQVSRGNEESAIAIDKISKDIADVFDTTKILRDSVSDMQDKLDKFSSAAGQIVSIADQVKKLSVQSKAAASSTQSDQGSMLKLIAQIFEVSKALTDKMESVKDSINDITAVTEEVSANSEEICAVATSLLDKE
jgi:hypothetical protein